MQSKIDQEVIDELVKMLEDHIAGGMKKPEAEAGEESEGSAIPGVDDERMEGDSAQGGVAHEASESPSDEDEELKKLMELYSKE